MLDQWNESNDLRSKFIAPSFIIVVNIFTSWSHGPWHNYISRLHTTSRLIESSTLFTSISLPRSHIPLDRALAALQPFPFYKISIISTFSSPPLYFHVSEIHRQFLLRSVYVIKIMDFIFYLDGHSLQEIMRSIVIPLGWTYIALWSLDEPPQELACKDGWFNPEMETGSSTAPSQSVGQTLFNLYKLCRFALDAGFSSSSPGSWSANGTLPYAASSGESAGFQCGSQES